MSPFLIGPLSCLQISILETKFDHLALTQQAHYLELKVRVSTLYKDRNRSRYIRVAGWALPAPPAYSETRSNLG